MKAYIIDSNLKGIFPIELDKELNYKDIYMFVFDHLDKHNLFGNGLIVGTNLEGESVSPEMSLNWYREKIAFADDLVRTEKYLVPPQFITIK